MCVSQLALQTIIYWCFALVECLELLVSICRFLLVGVFLVETFVFSAFDLLTSLFCCVF